MGIIHKNVGENVIMCLQVSSEPDIRYGKRCLLCGGPGLARRQGWPGRSHRRR